MGSIPFVSDALEILYDVGSIVKDILIAFITWLTRTFRYDNPLQMFALSLIFLCFIMGFVALFIGINAGEGRYSVDGPLRRVYVGPDSASDVYSSSGVPGLLFSKTLGNGSAYEVVPDNSMSGDSSVDQEDIDSDGTANSLDFDVDGDGLPNDMDPSPCGSASGCGNYPVMCGNDVCDNFKTDSRYISLDYLHLGCDSRDLWFDIPDYCLGGRLTMTYEIYEWNMSLVKKAVCDSSDLEVLLGPRCVLDNSSHEIWYEENRINCPHDCNDSLLYYKDLTCDRVDNCPSLYGQCCVGGKYMGYCFSDSGQSNIMMAFYCNNGMGIIGGSRPLEELRRARVHGPCTQDSDCLNDFGAHACCGSGTYYSGFCYRALGSFYPSEGCDL
jgi:hypothetical protein